MFSIASLIPFILLAVRAAGNHVVVRDNSVSLSFTKQFNYTSPHEVLLKDQARVQHLLALCEGKRNGTGTRTSKGKKGDVGLFDKGSGFVAKVGVGNPPHHCGFH
jgi:hypothetical protein